MLKFFLPRQTKKVLEESAAIQSGLTRNRLYARDTLSSSDLETLEALEKRYPPLLKARDVEGLEKLNKEVMRLGNRLFPSSPWDAWRENVEVFVIAAVMALAIRTFFLQPFKIPTGSMEPTLFGIEPVLTQTPPPNILARAFDFIVQGRTYSRVVTKQGGTVTGLEPGSITIWFEYTDVHLTDAGGNQEVDRIWIRSSDVRNKLHVMEGRTFNPGDVVAQFVTQTGDQVLVDKLTYNFRPPHRGEVFIFKTAGIPSLEHERGPDQEGSEDFIKRCVGLAGDVIQITPPRLMINGQLAEGSPVFAKQFARADGYPGYVHGDPNAGIGTLDGDTQSFYVPADCYWAMGDNSPNSADSRYWNGVPNQNLVGRGAFVFWPFTKRWGLIK